MEFGLSFGSLQDERTLSVRFQEGEKARHFVERFTMSAGDELRLEALLRPGEELRTFDLRSVDGDAVASTHGPLHPFDSRFDNVVPLREPMRARCRDVRRATGAFAAGCRWLGSLRFVPPRERRFPPTRPLTYGAAGAELLDVLAWDAREGDTLPERVSDWYERHFKMRLNITRTESGSETYRMRLGPVGATHDVDLCDTGEGMAQVLPVVTALYQAAQPASQGPWTLALEQPELHLHLDAQHALADLLCEVAKQPEAPTLLIETHSEGMLVALQLAVATGKLSPNNVIVHIVRSLADGSSVLDTVLFNSLGEPVGPWPHDMFRQVIDDARELAAARRRARAK